MDWVVGLGIGRGGVYLGKKRKEKGDEIGGC